ncbi:hypothetical protein [uncultured Desulfobacter sp.]|uniref:hypothetical protein n=1 Tax=uncultured Desulfobacter sp. TaxID=240139 RepID=UPI002AA7DC24|nr:hypothetical protein [uncultured Desulfobacter sp.]
MKILKLLLASVVLCFVMATNGFSYTITINGETTDVGSEDTFLKSDSMSGNSGDATETAWVNGYLASISETVKYVVREETVTIYKVGGTDSLYAVPMSDTDSDNDYPYNVTYVINNLNLFNISVMFWRKIQKEADDVAQYSPKRLFVPDSKI